jgi:hypothetical protein
MLFAVFVMLAMLPKIQYRYTSLGIITMRLPGLPDAILANSLRVFQEPSPYNILATSPFLLSYRYSSVLSPARHDAFEVA